MIITLNGKEYNLFFSIAGIDYLDQQYYTEVEGVRFGMGVGALLPQLEMGSVVGVFHAIKAGLFNKKVKDEWIEDYITKRAEKDELDELIEEIVDELKKQPLTRQTVRTLEKTLEKVKKDEISTDTKK